MSECLGICEIDYESGYCVGCGRSVDEIYGDDDDAPEPRSSADDDTTADKSPPAAGTPDTE